MGQFPICPNHTQYFTHNGPNKWFLFRKYVHFSYLLSFLSTFERANWQKQKHTNITSTKQILVQKFRLSPMTPRQQHNFNFSSCPSISHRVHNSIKPHMHMSCQWMTRVDDVQHQGEGYSGAKRRVLQNWHPPFDLFTDYADKVIGFCACARGVRTRGAQCVKWRARPLLMTGNHVTCVLSRVQRRYSRAAEPWFGCACQP